MLNRQVFYSSIIANLFGHMTQSQVDGITVILDVWERSFVQQTPITQLSVCFATAYHETAFTMRPIKEIGNLKYFALNYGIEGRNPARARQMGNVRPGDGAKYCGRGLPQLTWYVNYLKATKRLRELGLIDGSVDFTVTPEKVLDPEIAVLIMFIGMEEGWFTGKTLDQLVDSNVDGDEHADFVRSRAIINGSDRAEKIAGYADKFLKALRAATGT